MKKVLLSILLAVAAFSLQSCLHDDDEVFSDTAAVRIDKAVAEAKEILVSSPNGWMLHYFTGEQYTGGGYTMLIQFDGAKAHVSSDIHQKVDTVSTSSYDVIKDQGPVLTLNTYNEIFHFLAQPMSGAVDGEQGDYEFVIMSATPDSVVLQGRKWKNRMVMTRIPESLVWADYLTELRKVEDALASAYLVKNGEAVADTLVLDRDAHNALLSSETETVPYYYVPGGIEFQSPIVIGGHNIASLLLTDATTGELKDPAGTYTYERYSEEGRNMDIRPLFGEWQITYKPDGSNSYRTSKLELSQYDILLGKVSSKYLRVVFSYEGNVRYDYVYDEGSDSYDYKEEVGDGDYNMFLIYDSKTGEFYIPASYVYDVTERFTMGSLIMYPFDSKNRNTGDRVTFSYDAAAEKFVPKDLYDGLYFMYPAKDEDGDDTYYPRMIITGIKEITRVK